MDQVYIRPSHLDDALEALNAYGDRAHILAGGTDLLVRMRHDGIYPEVILDLGALGELRKISRDGDDIHLGALVTHRQIEKDAMLAGEAGMLVSACHQVGSVQIRNSGTIGGNLANASPAGDAVLALYLLEAAVHLQSKHRDRWVPVGEFITAPGQTTRRADEIICGVRFKRLPPDAAVFFEKVGQRQAVTISKASAGGIVRISQGCFQECRLALGAVAPTIIRLPEVEAALAGSPVSPQVIDRAAALAAATCHPIDDIRSTVAYRRHLVQVLVHRGLAAMVASAQSA
ncbi:MAG: xanthine dehydrogenase family protein subunit M [Anaerolineae bacterium]|nr:xanthine dehydrogenase family protein subunit M [Anaerolineae bacterium]